jgi:hypothetical protein
MTLTQSIRRTLRPAGKTAQAILKWRRFSFHETPPIFGNSKPKSGSHLLLQILNGFTQIMPYQYVDAEPVRTITRDGRRKPEAEILGELAKIPRGVIGWGYVEATKEIASFLTEAGRVNYFVYRDPRDLLVSHVFFATDMNEEHAMYDYYNSLPDLNARLKVAITGIDRDGLRMVGVKQRYEGVFQWLEQNNVLCIRFEDLINHRDATLGSILAEVEKTGYEIPTPRDQALDVLIESIQPKKSHTFRSGRTGGWREFFTDEHKRLFKDVAGDLVVRLGYEKNNDW